MSFRDTIAAISTPPGVGGIGLIRISGPEAEGIARRIFRSFRPLPSFASHHLYHGQIVLPETGEVLDEVLVAFMKAPGSFTGEDTIEISCHGGPLVLRTVLDEAIRSGARLAERGEFTQRAFLNGRIDLSQAEAVLDVITAQTREGLFSAVARLQGKLSDRIEVVRGAIVDLLAAVEAAIDFAEDDVAETSGNDLSKFEDVIGQVQALAATYRRGRIYREGANVVIAGRPNVGKSSLLNRLLGEKRAIVTSIPGTTRDFIEEAVDILGIPVRLTDTAGIRPPEDAIEREGIDLVWNRLAAADAVLLLLDGSAALNADDRELLGKMEAKPLIPVINKSDLPHIIDEETLQALLPKTAPSPIWISAKFGDGIDRLQQALHDFVLQTPAVDTQETMIAHLRHKIALEKTTERLTRAREGLRDGLPPELAALEIREALDALGEITGRTTAEDVLKRIFARFCIGK